MVFSSYRISTSSSTINNLNKISGANIFVDMTLEDVDFEDLIKY